MLKLFRNRATVVLVATALVLSACSSKGPSRNAFADEDSIMRFVPADTPYLLATGRQLPDELLDEIEPEMEMMMGAYQILIRAALEDAVQDSEAPMTDEQVEWLAAILNELTALVSVEGMRNAGRKGCRFSGISRGSDSGARHRCQSGSSKRASRTSSSGLRSRSSTDASSRNSRSTPVSSG